MTGTWAHNKHLRRPDTQQNIEGDPKRHLYECNVVYCHTKYIDCDPRRHLYVRNVIHGYTKTLKVTYEDIYMYIMLYKERLSIQISCFVYPISNYHMLMSK